MLDLLLDAIDDGESVLPKAHHHDAAYGFSLAVPVRHAAANLRAEGNTSQVADQNGHAVVRADGNVAQVGD